MVILTLLVSRTRLLLFSCACRFRKRIIWIVTNRVISLQLDFLLTMGAILSVFCPVSSATCILRSVLRGLATTGSGIGEAATVLGISVLVIIGASVLTATGMLLGVVSAVHATRSKRSPKTKLFKGTLTFTKVHQISQYCNILKTKV